MSDFWSACLDRFERDLPSQQFNTWIKSLRLEDDGLAASGADSASAPARRMRLLAPNRFILQWVRERYLAQIEALSHQYFTEPVNISLTLDETPRSTDAIAPDVATEPAPADSMSAEPLELVANVLPATRSEDPAYERSRLNPEFTFDALVSGRANDLARAAAQQCAQNPGTSYNPLFIYGGVGLGKTHLAHALGNEVWRQDPQRVVRYIHAHDYIADVVRAYQQKAFDVLKRYYSSLDLLIIDDIQFLGGNKERTQEEFFFAFNALIEAKKQIVITCDTYPKDIQGLEDRLISRFDWGLTVAIEPPELEMRVAILKKKAEATKMPLSDDVAFLIAKHLRSNVRELEGALNRVLAFARFHGRDITLDVAREALKDVIGATNRQITLESIQKTVADYFKIKVADMYSQRRTRAIARPRQVAMWLTRELTPHSLPEIGDAFGGRDHTTVMHACRTIADLRRTDNTLNNDLHVLMQTIKG
ncbi:chromosomal replication initiator protein DnaA [Sulfurisoma sediminicola]|uniref:Chromosomal replication initiator protein DnaA n=1 Tax=Sulfurisoma sediminicola TaxID=1381557 RepID=A0A497XPX8_9PROT|nr:chromosomal replication initiator protein DnaA [Sulfurisoma sediminicola]RLJ68199.1 chromosomal replication initiator protein DnaA [Sulfurisoma sediminicola]